MTTTHLYNVFFQNGRYLTDENTIDDCGEPMDLDFYEAEAFAAEHPDAYTVPSRAYAIVDDHGTPTPVRLITPPAPHDAHVFLWTWHSSEAEAMLASC